MSRTLKDHLFGSGPKRILALDGGGIRGVITLRILARIEEIVGSPLSEYFDLIGGTSTGSIIAAGLAHGWPVAHLIELYDRLGESVFQGNFLRRGLLRTKFPAEPLRKALKAQFEDHPLGGKELRTGLAIMTKRLDTGSPWVLHNNPKGKYFGPRTGSTSVPNRDYLLRDIVRASTAAPSYFEPEKIRVATGVNGAFVDGGASPHNNPSLQLLLLATLKGYGLEWPLGAGNLLIVSVGTGTWEIRHDPKDLLKMKPVENAVLALTSMMRDASDLNELLLQWLSTSPTARVIDREVGDLRDDLVGGKPWVSYLRYEAPIDLEWLQKMLPGEKITEKDLKSLRKMDNPKNIAMLGKIGDAARGSVKPEHFPAAFALA